MNRYSLADTVSLLARPSPSGLTDLWNAVPDGYKLPPQTVRSLQTANQTAILQQFAVAQQKLVVAAGNSVGFRPEVFDRIADLPGVDLAAEVASQIWTNNLDISAIGDATRKLVGEILDRAGVSVGLSVPLESYSAAAFQIAQVVLFAVNTIVQWERIESEIAKAERLAALDCPPPGFSAPVDQAEVDAALGLVRSYDWRDLFLPEVRPVNPYGVLGFTCCISTVDGGRVIAPIGSGIGNRVQSAIGAIPEPGSATNIIPPEVYGIERGYGCLPMCPQLPVHRSIVMPSGQAHRTYDAAESLPLLASFGQSAWHLIWNPGPASFAVDGNAIADAWSEYLQIMRAQILGNEVGFGTLGGPVCDDWPLYRRKLPLEWLYARIGVPKKWAERAEGIYTFEDSLPVSQWRRFADFQESLLSRLMVAYVDAGTCAPGWRDRVHRAQLDLLEHPRAVCDLDVDSIPNENFRATVIARRQSKGVWCYGVGGQDVRPSGAPSGAPSLGALGERVPPIPTMPFPLPPISVGTTNGGGAGLGIAIGVLALGLLAFGVLRR